MRILAWLLAAYAVFGTILVVAALLVGGPLVSRLDRVTTSALDTMAAATEATRVAADAFDGFDVSIAEARASTDDAAGLTRETAVTLDALGAAMGISLFGAQPLLPLADQFERSAGQMRQLGDNLEGIGEALDNNRDDIAQVGAQMRILANRLETFERRITAERLGGGIPLSWLFYGFLAWQVLPILAAAVGAAWIFRNTRSVVAPPPPPAGS